MDFCQRISSMDVSGMMQHDTPMQDRDNGFDAIAAAAFMRQSPGCAAFGYQVQNVNSSPRRATPMELETVTRTGKSVAELMTNNPTTNKSPLFVGSSLPCTPGGIVDVACDSEANAETQARCTESQEAMLDNLSAPVAFFAAPAVVGSSSKAVVCVASKSTAAESTGAGGDAESTGAGGDSGTNTMARRDQSAGAEEMRAAPNSDGEPSRAQPVQQALPLQKTTYITVHLQEAGRMFLFFAIVCLVASNHLSIRVHPPASPQLVSHANPPLELGRAFFYPSSDNLVGMLTCLVAGIFTTYAETDQRVSFKVKPATRIVILKSKYCEKKNIDAGSIRLLYDGARLSDTTLIQDLEIDDGDM